MAVRTALILGLGNRLLADDAAGPLVIDLLENDIPDDVVLCDGGTAGLNLLPEIEDCCALIAVDAARFGEDAGTVRTFEGEEMDRQMAGLKSTAHEVALADLISAAKLMGACPEQRALVAVEPENIGIGLEPTPAVARAIPEMAAAVRNILNRWRMEVPDS